MAQNVAPGVYTQIVDLSEFVASVPSTIGLLAIISERGPDNELIQTNARDFTNIFGQPNIMYAGKDFGQGPYVATSFLKESDNLYVIRILPYDSDEILNDDGDPMESATYANMVIKTQNVSNDDASCTVTVGTEESLKKESDITTLFADNGTGDEDTAVVIYGYGRGAYYNNYQINISAHANPEKSALGIYVLDVFKKQAVSTIENTFDASWAIVSSFEVSFDPEAVFSGSDGGSMYIEDIINNYFGNELRCKADSDVLRNLAARAALTETDPATGLNPVTIDFSEPFYVFVDDNYTLIPDQVQGVQLQYGTEGNLFKLNKKIDVQLATTLLTQAYSGLLETPRDSQSNIENRPLDTQNYYFNIIMDAGYPTPVKTAIVGLSDTRRDCISIIDNGDNLSFSDSLNRRKGLGVFAESGDREDDSHFSYNTKYTALYEPFSKIDDPYTGREIWLTPIYHMANIIPYTDNITEIWYPPAGFNRATIASIKSLRFSASQGERDQFYLNQINPIIRSPIGFVMMGQSTTQRKPSALQDLSVMRLILYIKRALEQFCEAYIFELNNEDTWNAIGLEVNRFLKTIQNRRGLYDFSVEVGADEYEIKTKKLHVNVTLTPTRAVEQIQLKFFIK